MNKEAYHSILVSPSTLIHPCLSYESVQYPIDFLSSKSPLNFIFFLSAVMTPIPIPKESPPYFSRRIVIVEFGAKGFYPVI